MAVKRIEPNILRRIDERRWELVGDAERRPGQTARNARAQAVRDATGREPDDGDVYAVLPRSDLRVAQEL